METNSLPSSTDEIAPAWPCSRRGLPGRTHYCARRWSLTPPFHHHLSTRRSERLSVSVALFRQVHASRRFPRPGCYPTSCSMECGLSSTPTTQGRDCPTSLRRFHNTRAGRESQLYSEPIFAFGRNHASVTTHPLRKSHAKFDCRIWQKDIKIGGQSCTSRSPRESFAWEIYHRFDRQYRHW